jgi:accessory colonization factor AcfC
MLMRNTAFAARHVGATIAWNIEITTHVREDIRVTDRNSDIIVIVRKDITSSVENSEITAKAREDALKVDIEGNWIWWLLMAWINMLI